MTRAQIPGFAVFAILVLLIIFVSTCALQKGYKLGQETVQIVAPNTCQGKTAEQFWNSLSQAAGAKQYSTASSELVTYASCKEFRGTSMPPQLESTVFEIAKADWTTDFAAKNYADSKELLSFYLANYPDSAHASQAVAMIRRSEDAEAGRLVPPVPPRTP